VAATLTFWVPGLGYLYAGSPRLGLALLLGVPVVEVLFLLGFLIPVRIVNLLVPVGLILVLRIALAVIVARETRRLAADQPVRWFSRWPALWATFVMVGLANHFYAYVVSTTLVKAYVLPTGSMAPTIVPGDRLLTLSCAYGWRVPLFSGAVFGARPAKRGDLVVFPRPESPGNPFIKRVIGLPGERLEIRRKTVFVDGRPLEEPHAHFIEPRVDAGGARQGPRDDWGPQEVPPESYFVLGDNRDNSRDSRFFGFIDQKDLLGRAGLIYWSEDPQTGRVREERLGRWVE
jgi:signal peptidase I